MGFVVQRVDDDVIIAEALGKGVSLSLLSECGPAYKAFRVLVTPPTTLKAYKFFVENQQFKYDRLAYIYTLLQRTILPFFPYWDNQRYTCWELVNKFCSTYGFDWAPVDSYALITDFLAAAGEPIFISDEAV